MKPVAVVIGAGIAGLAMARALSLRGYIVKVIERNHRAVGASIRNFGMVWPIGQPEGELYECAKRSASIWKEFTSEAHIYRDLSGSVHLAYQKDEETVLTELFEYYQKNRPLKLLRKNEVTALCPAAVEKGLLAGLFSNDEMIIDPREAIGELPGYLQAKYGVHFIWNEAVIAVKEGLVQTARGRYECDIVMVCSGVEFETLFPEQFIDHSVTKCKLQMMRFGEQPGGWRMGPAMCGGLSLTHYHSFRVAPSLKALRKRVSLEMHDYMDWGIHVMVSQNGRNELTVGDSHEYGGTHDPFDRTYINDLILDYLKTFARFPNEQVVETWNGVYAKMSKGEPYLFNCPKPGVYVFNGLGGAGMTLSFGLSESLVRDL